MAEGHNRRNDSSQMKDLIQFDDHSENCHQEKHEHETEHNSKDSSSQAGCTSSSSCSSGPSSAGAAGRTQAEWEEREEPVETQREDGTSSCCHLDDLKRLPQCQKKLGPLQFSSDHTILIDVVAFRNEGLKPQQGREMWHSNFVKMPCSPSSIITKTGLTKQQVVRWKVITKHLNNLAKKTTVSVENVKEAIIKYNPKYEGQWSFDALANFVQRIPKVENYFDTLFPKIAALALKLPQYVMKAIPLLQRGHAATITLSQVQISCLLANAFFCTFPHRNTSSSNAEYHSYPTINFSSLFGNWSERKKEKLRAIMHYFNVVTDETTKPNGLVTFERRCLRDTDVPNWRSCKEKMPKLHVTSHGTIETEGTGMLQVDFASSWIGGGVLGSGLVQEEILFLINPELIVARLFTEKLNDNECLIITGSQQFSCYFGFGDTFEWAGPHEDRLRRDKWNRLERQILAIDALNFKHRREQYNMAKVTRELNKAYCGFKCHGDNEPDIATGKWGCGAFNGDPQLKAVIQLMAAAKAKRGLAFFSFKDEKLKQDLQQTYHLLVTEQTTVDKLYGLLEDYCVFQRTSGGPHVDLFEFLRNSIRHSRSQL
ncbi:poly(ADP-ribose) glycohydrolase isoform X2 [Siniperca chuatsi]|nr:poly(ADP-ribose) glycohydrolase isoform X2 [Siniperca chuatsi]XP_044030997.1 poly(ADP-ribose) glycohydrolase isoform X2 [Siniperca chuatsi]XP_044030998.1 poly(ADP-ribose) glycohydrolase isoform X2 [Siniperca chuatsi]